MANKVLRLDITKTPELIPIIYGRVGDGLIQVVDVYVTNNGEPFNLTGYTLKFEGNTSGNRSFIQDSDNIKVKDAVKGYFTYTFPLVSFAVPGKYEHAYFSFTKGLMKETTSDFDIQIFDNADITAEEAHTVISEYEKLVDELNEIFLKANTDLQDDFDDFKTTYDKKYSDYTADLTNKISEAQSKIDALNNNYTKAEAKVTELENRLQELINNGLLKMEDVVFFLQGKTSVTIDGKAVKVDEVIPTFTFLTNNHYTKTQTDSKYVNLTAAQTIGGKKTFSTQPYYNTYKLMSENDVFSKTEINKMLTSFYSQHSPISKTANLNEITVFGIYDLIDFAGTNGPELGIALNGKLEVYYNFDEKNIVMQRITIGKPGTTDTGTYVRFGNIQSTITWTSWNAVGAQPATSEEAIAGKVTNKYISPKTLFDSLESIGVFDDPQLEAWYGPGTEIDDASSQTNLPVGLLTNVSHGKDESDLPFTLSADRKVFTMKRNATLYIEQLQEGRGNSEAARTDYFYFTFRAGGKSYDGHKYGIDGGDTAINLSHNSAASLMVTLNEGDTFYTYPSTRDTDKRVLWKASLKGTYIREVKSSLRSQVNSLAEKISESEAEIATKEEAEAGLNNTKLMSPLRTAQAISKKAVLIEGNQTVSGLKNFSDGIKVGDKVPILTKDEADFAMVDKNNNSSVMSEGSLKLFRRGDLVYLTGSFKLSASKYNQGVWFDIPSWAYPIEHVRIYGKAGSNMILLFINLSSNNNIVCVDNVAKDSWITTSECWMARDPY